MIGWQIIHLIGLVNERAQLHPTDPMYAPRVRKLDADIELTAAEIDQALQQLIVQRRGGPR